ncbi:MAG: ankyrin repeat domain-containing protein [Bacteriovoracaceae bacterium]
MKYLLMPVFFFIVGYTSIHHFFIQGTMKKPARDISSEKPARDISSEKPARDISSEKPARFISSEKPVSFDHLNVYKAITKNAPIPGPLFFAIKLNQLNKVKELIEKGHNLEELNEKRQNALMVAVELGHQEIFDYLLAQKFDLDHQDIYGMTALMIAAEKNYFKMLKPMLKKEHDLSILSAKEKSVYDYAKETKSYASLKMLQNLEAPCNTSCEL